MVTVIMNKLVEASESKDNKQIKAIRGMNDLLPKDMPYWHYMENCLKRLAVSYGYTEIRTPIIESTDLFKRGVGEITDIVEKEMYTFSDRNGDHLALRPEGTASVVRAGIEHSLFYGDNPKVWYLGPMYRHERPQKGRYRQFYQFGMEAFGYNSPYIDLEILTFCHRLWQALGLENKLQLQINCLGNKDVRAKYRQALVSYFSTHNEILDEDSKRRLETNPLRILDSKNPDLQTLIAKAPKLNEYLDEASAQHMQVLCAGLNALNINYTVNPYLVRGLDYYCLTVFEWIADGSCLLGAQGTVCAGGRYDGLVAQLGGEQTAAMGMSIGLERLILALQAQENLKLAAMVDCYVALLGDKALLHGLVAAEKIHSALPGLKLYVNLSGQSFKSQFKKADKIHARLAIIIGDSEVDEANYTVKWLQEHKEQEKLSFDGLIKLLHELFDTAD